MTHLLVLSIGPIQEFISAARRTRDLWFGSQLLSEISRAAAAKIVEAKGTLIFPESLKPGNVANIILAQLPEGVDPREMANRAKQAAHDKWNFIAKGAFDKVVEILVENRWDNQNKDVVECYAAWVEETGNYSEDRKELMRLLAGRKSFRDFRPFLGEPGVPKSSLDGQRETVLVGPKNEEDPKRQRDSWPKGIRMKMRLTSGEQLDVVGVVKRVGLVEKSGDGRFPSVSRVAAEPFIEAMSPQNLEKLRDACAKLEDLGLQRVREKYYASFPFEGSILYKDRQPQLADELGLRDGAFVKEFEEVNKILGKAVPNPYMAVLVADGDKMGEAISKCTKVSEHQTLSAALAYFASKAQTIVEYHKGVLIYAGGDDVVALLPIHTSLACAEKLHESFGTTMESYHCTLSVGIGIGHFLENLEDLLNYGRAAEKDAKNPDRNGLAVHLHKRGGSPVRFRASWKNKPDKVLLDFAEWFNEDQMPSKLPYDLRKLADVYENWGDDKVVEKAIVQDAIRVIRDKRPGLEKGRLKEIENLIRARVKTPQELRELVETLLIARLLGGVVGATKKTDKRVAGVQR